MGINKLVPPLSPPPRLRGNSPPPKVPQERGGPFPSTIPFSHVDHPSQENRVGTVKEPSLFSIADSRRCQETWLGIRVVSQFLWRKMEFSGFSGRRKTSQSAKSLGGGPPEGPKRAGPRLPGERREGGGPGKSGFFGNIFLIS